MTGSSRQSDKKIAFTDPANFTPYFSWTTAERSSTGLEQVVCESAPLADIAKRFDTPAYVYSQTAIESAYRELESGLRGVPHTICFAVKSNANLSILRKLASLGSGFDVVSGGELELLKAIGARGDRIVFSGVGKTREEIRAALRYPGPKRGGARGVLLFNVESPAELEILLSESASEMKHGGARPSVSIRINPDVQAGGHPKISTGHHQHKFGLDWPTAKRLYQANKASRWIQWRGISSHIGSQIVTLDPFRSALHRVTEYAKELKSEGIALQYLDFGGGLGVRYTDEHPATRQAYARMAANVVAPLGMHLLLEPGRAIVGPAGVLLTRVLYTKENRGKTFVIVDAAMNDLMRPTLYGAIHPITRVTRSRAKGVRAKRVDVAGPICETGDFFLRDWPLPEAESGDVLAIWVAGAYGMSQASNYNSRCRAVEVLVKGKNAKIIRRRESVRDLIRGQLNVEAWR